MNANIQSAYESRSAGFRRRSVEYRGAVLPRSIAVLAIEAGVSNLWRACTGFDGDVIGIDRFGESAPTDEVARALGFALQAQCTRARPLAARELRP